MVKLISLKRNFYLIKIKVNWNILVTNKKSKEISIVSVREFEKNYFYPKLKKLINKLGKSPNWNKKIIY